MVTKMIQLGDKVDIRVMQQVEQSESTGISPHVYKSKVNDIGDHGEIEIIMPIENGRIVLLPLGIRYEFVFYSNSGLFRSVGQIKERFKRDNIFVFIIELHTQLNKYQRREYYRYPCTLDSQYFIISEEEARTKLTEEIFQSLRDDDFYNRQKKGIIVDLSGGGIRLITEERPSENAYILLILHLVNETLDEQLFIIGRILSSEKLLDKNGLYECRIQFIFTDSLIREEIIRYIFEEERKSRLKKKG